MIGIVRRLGLGFASFVIAALCLALLGGLVPQVLGNSTNLFVAVLLGYAIFRDILRREALRAAARVDERN